MSTTLPPKGDASVAGASQPDRITDHDLLGGGDSDGKPEVEHHSGDVTSAAELTPEELELEKKLKKKIDTLIMPLVVLVYLMNYIDRNNYAAARLQGLETDLNLSDSQYQLGLSILFVGYILAQVPSNMLLNYMGRPSLYLGLFTMLWGSVSALTSLVKSFGQIVACRFILGMVEAPFFPGVLFYLSKWYTKSELNLRMSIFYSGSLISGAFGNLIAGGILSGLGNSHGLSPWQWLYIIEGVITVAVGFLLILVLPDFPDTWKGLSPELKQIANRRLAIEAAQADVDEAGGMSQLKGFKLAMMDPCTYVLALSYMCATGTAGFQNFFPTLTSTFVAGDDRVKALLLCAPPYLFITVGSLVHSVFSDRVGNRFWFYMYPIPLRNIPRVTIVGFLIFMFVDDSNFGAKYFSLFLMVVVFNMNGTTYAWIANAIPRPPAKRAAAFAFINSIGNSASIWTPFTYRQKDFPSYKLAMGINIGLQAVAAVCGVLMWYILTSRNKQLERMENEDSELSGKDLAVLQKTADLAGVDIATARRQQKGYRYMI
uniref:MFS transporter n=1 Tax=Pyricularia oryzae (strain P131) TaxID=1143193 RepID=L7IWX0_PYRO1